MLTNKRVLLVDDNNVNLIVAQTILKRAGVEVTTAVNGALAIDEIKKAQFDAILMDIQMPVMSGLEAASYIRETLEMTDIPIIAISANIMESDIKKSLKAGMVAHLGKPIVGQELLNTLEHHLKQTYH